MNSNEHKGQYHLIYGNASNMDILRNEEVDLVLAGPPYWPPEIEPLLRVPIAEQDKLEDVRQEVISYGLKLRPVFQEIERVLKPGGTLVVHTRDVRYANVLIGLTDTHRNLVESAGINLFSRIYWHKMHKSSPALRFGKSPKVYSFQADDVEDVMIFRKPGSGPEAKGKVELDASEVSKCLSPLWQMAPASKKRIHPHQAPDTLLRRMISMFSHPGDLVVDPFAGSGSTLRMAVEMKRRAVGYEIVDSYVENADKFVERGISKPKIR